MLRYSSARIDGWFAAVDGDPTGRNFLIFMTYKDGSGISVSEIVTLSPDGRRRMRAAQYIADGRIVRRTLIDEERRGR